MLNSSDNSRTATKLTASRTDRISIAPSIYRKYEPSLLGALGIAVFLVLWELLPALGLVRPLFTSSPSRVLVAAKWLIANGLWNDILISGTEFGIGFLLAVLVGVPSGVLLGWYR